MRRVLDKEKFRAPDVFWTDRSWLDSTRKRLDSQNLATYPQKESEKQGGPEVVIRATFPAPRNGAALTADFAPYGAAMDSGYYVEDIPANDVSPKTRAAVQGSGNEDAAGISTLLRDHAPQHTAARTTELPAKEKVQLLP